jgi:hypothetical protein
MTGPVLLLSSAPVVSSSMPVVVVPAPEGSVVSGVSVVVSRMVPSEVSRMVSLEVGVGSPVVPMPIVAAVGSLEGPWLTKPDRPVAEVSEPPAQASRKMEASRAGWARRDIVAS